MSRNGRRYRAGHARVQLALIAAIAFALLAPQAASAGKPAAAKTRPVVAVGNAFAGTVSFLDATTYANLGSFNIVPDLESRKLALFLNPITYIAYQEVRSQRGGENYVDDVATSPDGTRLYVSRGILQDVAAFDTRTGQMLWRTNIGGFTADHMAINKAGTRLIVSDITSGYERVFDPATGRIIASVAAGTYPHGVEYSANEARLYVGSIGTVSYPYSQNYLKGDRQITVIDASRWSVQKVFKFQFGVRPFVVTNDERYIYMQRSYNRGFVEFDLASGTITRNMNTLPTTPEGDALFPDNLPRNSMHHGLAISSDETKICNAGTIDNYVAIVDRASFATTRVTYAQNIPYWAMTSADGRACLVSNSGGDFVSIFDYATGTEIKRVPTGDYPQRMRVGQLSSAAVLSPSIG